VRPSLDSALLFVRAEPEAAVAPRPPGRGARVREPGGAAGVTADAAARLSFDEIYEAYFDFVWCNARRLGVPEASVDDAVQEVFLVVHRRLGEFEGRSSLKTWLFQIVLRVASNQRRANRRKSPFTDPRAAPVDADAIADERAGSPDDGLARRQGVRLLYKLLGELDDDKRAVFVLAELEQMSAPDIAEALGVNVNTVYARLRAARRQFEQAIAREHARDTWRAG
jgi:RNA polymerase sigma-70 factor (ECF subfamily)